ncbi:MAG: fructose-1,6-bisphosphatase [Clostridia bacterium]|nr:fructose-1,6-bisphosphatase [Clostridia bacterium]
MSTKNQRVLELLSKRFPNVASATSEIINLNAILELPKGTEHFISDLHGEYEAFCHILRNASGVIRIKMEEVFGSSLTEEEKRALATLIYYPKERLLYLKKHQELTDGWYYHTLSCLIQLSRGIASKYTRSKVRKALPQDFSYIIEELLQEEKSLADKEYYYRRILETILKTKRSDAFIIAISRLIQRLSIDRLHILGDIYDRGPGPHVIMDTLMAYHSIDIAWGNHDILWMGAAGGNLACIASVVRICARYNQLEILENGYGISLRQLSSFADACYRNKISEAFYPKTKKHSSEDTEFFSLACLQKAAAILQFKAEDAILARHPEYEMESRRLLSAVDIKHKTVTADNKTYPLTDCHFPTSVEDEMCRFTKEEWELLQKLRYEFIHSPRLQEHVRFLLSNGGMFQAENQNLMYHGCIPMEEDGSFSECMGYRGKRWLRYCDDMVRKGILTAEEHPRKETYRDFFWYLWCGKNSPLFGKQKMATFERYFIGEQSACRETKNPYYRHLAGENGKAYAKKILREFGLDEQEGHLVNGHVPVRQNKGESPVKAGGKLFVIDGGLSRAYQKQTGIAGYTLIYSSRGFFLTAHQPFSSTEEAVAHQTDIVSYPVVSSAFKRRMSVRNTDTGKALLLQIGELEALVEAYRSGSLPEM